MQLLSERRADSRQDAAVPWPATGPFSPDDDAAYRRWRDDKLARRPHGTDALVVEVDDPAALTPAERDALLQRCWDANMAIYRSRRAARDPSIARALGAQLGLHRLDRNWLADEDGISLIAVGSATDGTGDGYIPYTDRAIRWHTDGYYHPPERRIDAMILHCAAPAASGGVNRLLDHELAYIALREADPEGLCALMSPCAMTIPARMDEQGTKVLRAEQPGPVYSVDPTSGALHMRYTARTRSIAWRDDPMTRAAATWLLDWLDGDNPWRHELRLEAGMGIVANNVLHDRSTFADDPDRPRQLYRARYLDRIATPSRDGG